MFIINAYKDLGIKAKFFSETNNSLSADSDFCFAKKRDFDIAIIGCGAYGLPLAAYVKSIGKQSIHLAGKTQLLFGIKGKRWHDDPLTPYNKYWISPLPEDTPKNDTKIEKGCYW